MDSYYHSKQNIESRNAFDYAGDKHGKLKLGDVADVWIPNIFKREYVEDSRYGCPYFTGKEIYELLPSTDLNLKQDVARRNRLILSTGMILIQDSGQISGLIGRPVLVGKHLNGSACTNNMVRVNPFAQDDNGYLFALLSTHHGIRLLKRESSGSSIPHLEEGRIKNLVIPWPNEIIRKSIGSEVITALDLRGSAIDMENEARALVERAIKEGAD
jgi:type I restriction enzyme S subunit